MSKENIETNVVKPNLSFKDNDTEYNILDKEFETELDKSEALVEKYMVDNDGKDKPEEEKDKLYKEVQELWNDYAKTQLNTKYNFFLNRREYDFLTDLILNKIEYDVNTVFVAIELTNLFANMKTESNFSDDDEKISFDVTATEITYIYHLISNHKVKGLSKKSYTFANVLRRIGDISKAVNYYDTVGKNLKSDIHKWVAMFDPNVVEEKAKTTEVEQIETV